MIFTDYWKLLVLIFSGIRNTVFFWAKELRERWCLLITEKLLFWTFRWWEIRSFLSKEVDGKIVFTGYWAKKFFSQKFDVKMMFTWSFWAYHDLPGLGKCGFLCSGIWTLFTQWMEIIVRSAPSLLLLSWELSVSMKKTRWIEKMLENTLRRSSFLIIKHPF